jgi:hypothetical protein
MTVGTSACSQKDDAGKNSRAGAANSDTRPRFCLNARSVRVLRSNERGVIRLKSAEKPAAAIYSFDPKPQQRVGNWIA